MPFRFTYLCQLLEKLEQPYREKRFILPKDLKTYTENQTLQWFKNHRDRLNEFATNQDAVMAMLRPETWIGREYLGNEEHLEPFLWRAIQFSRPERAELQKWKTHPSTGDLGAQVGRILGDRENANNFNIPKAEEVTVEEVDQCLLEIAAHNNKSSPEIQSLRSSCLVNDPDGSLRVIYCRLRPQEAKWMTRLLLKRTDPVKVPADFGVTSGHSMLPNCIRVHVELSSSSPTTLHIGKTGLVKAKPQPLPPCTPQSSDPINRRRSPTPERRERRGSPETDLRPRKRGRRNSRGLRSMNRSVSRPRMVEQKEIGHILQESIPTPPSSKPKPSSPKPPPLPPTPDVPEVSYPQPVAKRRRISRESSPGPIVFQKGILRPSRPTKITNNPPPNKVLANPKVTRDSLPEAKIPQNCPAFQLASSGEGRMVPVPNNTEQPASSLSQADVVRDRTSKSRDTHKAPSLKKIMDSNIASSQPLPTPVSSDAASQSLQEEMNSEDNTTTPSLSSHSAKPIQPQDVPKPSVENSQSSSSTPVLPTTLSTSTSPLITAGTGPCSLSTNPCPLTSSIFLLSPYLPSSAQERLTSFLLPIHGCTYISTLTDLFHPSLPTRNHTTHTRYQKIVLIEPREPTISARFMHEVQDHQLSQGGGCELKRKEKIHIYDWRLLEVIGGREYDGRAMEGAWEKCWMATI
ncbi:hypothetical protein HYFRA_00003632 [Hymenoscyphus fraxineus]|uniref:DNA ligase ATP-dependent N-terminal domain-containing protein n=1 Tax=Hymenoscyphus fraxineus TaxID=746836 RepID=A0A9N9L2A6_9HELO|nr:hypothetical protein HYFRA_00003632 [Hymenoscyphus fraxineus]